MEHIFYSEGTREKKEYSPKIKFTFAENCFRFIPKVIRVPQVQITYRKKRGKKTHNFQEEIKLF